jgi:hypothetical protein
MDRAVYCVFLREEGWIIQFDGKEFGPCSSRELAVSVAVRAAKIAREMGFEVQIMAHDGAQFRTVFNGRSQIAS